MAENPAPRLFLELWSAARRSTRMVAELLAEHGIGDNELAALLHLAASPSGLTVTELAHEMGAAFMSVSDAVGRLERDGDTTRVPHPTDRRATVVQLSARGRRRAQAAQRLLDELERTAAARSRPDLGRLAAELNAAFRD